MGAPAWLAFLLNMLKDWRAFDSSRTVDGKVDRAENNDQLIGECDGHHFRHPLVARLNRPQATRASPHRLRYGTVAVTAKPDLGA